MAKMTMGSLPSFNHEGQEWSIYREKLEQWFLANDLVDSSEEDKAGIKRRAILLSGLAESTYRLAGNLALPDKVENLNYKKIIELFNGHFETKKCGFAERAKFYGASQHSDESMSEWAARIRSLASDCEFKATELNELLRDRFVLGMTVGPERDILFTKGLAELTLVEAQEVAENVRSARVGARQSGAVTVYEPLQVLKVASPSSRGESGAAAPAGARRARAVASGLAARSAGTARRGRGARPIGFHAESQCLVCGHTGHSREVCRFAKYTCNRCGLKGHLKKMCLNNANFESGRRHFIECSANGDADDGKRNIYNIRTNYGEPMRVRVMVNENALNFEVDTGSAVTIISEVIYDRLFSHLKLRPSKIILRSYSGECVDILGNLSLRFRYKFVKRDLTVYIVRGDGPLLLGRDFILNFNLEMCSADKCNSVLMLDMTSKYPKLFSNKLGCFKDLKVQLKLKDGSKPIFCKARSLPFALHKGVELELNRLVELGILVPVKFSEFASPIVPVLKQDKSIRLCADYSVSINKQLLIERYPLPKIEELFAKLNGGQTFSKLDLSQAYNQLCLSDDSQMLTCINTHKGLFKYTRLVFGLSSAPAIFQRTMETVLAGLDGVLVYLDDILITGSNSNEHLRRLSDVFRRLENAGFVLQTEKCSFFQNSISYLGFIIDKNGIHKSPEKVKAILDAKVPTNVTELKSFLGLVNYYRSFVKNASAMLSPLHDLLQKNCSWKWEKAHNEAFKEIKSELAMEKNLAHFNPVAKLCLTVDASPNGLGAILSQIENGVEKPLSYASRSLSAAEKR